MNQRLQIILKRFLVWIMISTKFRELFHSTSRGCATMFNKHAPFETGCRISHFRKRKEGWDVINRRDDSVSPHITNSRPSSPFVSGSIFLSIHIGSVPPCSLLKVHWRILLTDVFHRKQLLSDGSKQMPHPLLSMPNAFTPQCTYVHFRAMRVNKHRRRSDRCF